MTDRNRPILRLQSNEKSLSRPVWTSNNLHAYRHKHAGSTIIENYYVKRKGLG